MTTALSSCDPQMDRRGPIETYARVGWLRGLIVGGSGVLSLLPGGALYSSTVAAADAVITSKAQEVAERRLTALCLAWESELNKLESSKVDSAFLETEEFIDLAFRAWEAAKRTRDSERIRHYARILVGSAVPEIRSGHQPELYLAILAEMTSGELHIAKVLFGMQRGRPNSNENELQWMMRTQQVSMLESEGPLTGHGQWQRIADLSDSVGVDEIQSTLLRLQRHGLVGELSGGYLGYSGGVFAITETFRKLMQFLESGEVV